MLLRLSEGVNTGRGASALDIEGAPQVMATRVSDGLLNFHANFLLADLRYIIAHNERPRLNTSTAQK